MAIQQNVCIRGMHCKSCELLIEQKLSLIPGVSRVHVSQSQGSATIFTDNEVSLAMLNDALTGTKYSAHDKKNNVPTEHRRFSLRNFGASLLIIIALYIITKKLNVIPQFDVNSAMSVSVAFATGLVAAFSSCIAVTGSLLAALSSRYNSAHPNTSKLQRLGMHATFNIGRIFSYVFFGALLGALGSTLSFSPKFFGFVTILTSFAMIILGLKILNIFPVLEKFTFTMPKFIGRHFAGSTGNGQHNAFLLGAATFFFPCGFTQALQLYVISAGDALQGALIMGMFALGTLPALLSVGLISSLRNRTFLHYFNRVAGALVFVIGLTSINNGMVLAGAPTIDSWLKKASGDNVRALDNKNGVQIAYMKVTGLDYYPTEFTIQKGIPVEWRIDGRDARGCARVIAAPKLGIMERLLPNSETMIRFTPTNTGTIAFSCSMGMAGPGQFNVVASVNAEKITSPQIPCDSSAQQCLQ